MKSFSWSCSNNNCLLTGILHLQSNNLLPLQILCSFWHYSDILEHKYDILKKSSGYLSFSLLPFSNIHQVLPCSLWNTLPSWLLGNHSIDSLPISPTYFSKFLLLDPASLLNLWILECLGFCPRTLILHLLQVDIHFNNLIRSHGIKHCQCWWHPHFLTSGLAFFHQLLYSAFHLYDISILICPKQYFWLSSIFNYGISHFSN